MSSATLTPVRTQLSPSLTFLLAGGTGLAVAALYYSQPTLAVIGADLGASGRAVGWIPKIGRAHV